MSTFSMLLPADGGAADDVVLQGFRQVEEREFEYESPAAGLLLPEERKLHRGIHRAFLQKELISRKHRPM